MGQNSKSMNSRDVYTASSSVARTFPLHAHFNQNSPQDNHRHAHTSKKPTQPHPTRRPSREAKPSRSGISGIIVRTTNKSPYYMCKYLQYMHDFFLSSPVRREKTPGRNMTQQRSHAKHIHCCRPPAPSVQNNLDTCKASRMPGRMEALPTS